MSTPRQRIAEVVAFYQTSLALAAVRMDRARVSAKYWREGVPDPFRRSQVRYYARLLIEAYRDHRRLTKSLIDELVILRG